MNTTTVGPRVGSTSSTQDEGTGTVVGFLAHTRDRLLLPRKVARWKKEPSQAALSELVQCLLRLGQVENAWNYARQGYQRFRDNDLVRELWRIAARAHAELGFKAATDEIQERPSANAFLKLARCAVLLRDLSTAFHALEECLQRFPTSAAAHAALAELLEQRWLRDLAAGDGRAVISHLRKAWRLDGADFARPLRLAAFLARVGALRAALAVVDEVLQLDEKQAEAIAQRAALFKTISEELETSGGEARHDDDVDVLLRQTEEQGRVVNDPSDSARVGRESEKLCAYLPALKERTGCEKALVLEPKGATWDEKGPVGVNPLTTLATNLVRSAEVTTRRADLGPVLSVTLETAGGSLLLQRAQRCAVAVLIDKPDAVEQGRAALRDLIEGRLAATTTPRTPR